MIKLPISLVLAIVLATFILMPQSGFSQNETNAEGRRIGNWVVTGAISKKPGYAADAKVEEGTYEAGRKVGVWKAYYPSGKIKNEITFVMGRPKGPYTTYYENGQIEEQGNWNMTKNYGGFKRYYENGNVQQDFTFNSSGKREGVQKYFHENGQLMIEGNWDGGKESGEVKEYYETGELKSVKVFDGGTIDANQTKTYQSEKLSKAEQAPKLAPEPVKTATEPVKKAEAVDPKDSAPNIGLFTGTGVHTLYNRDKQISKKGYFKNGVLQNGKVYNYNSDGILTNIEIYKQGYYVGEGVIDKSQQQ